MDTEVFVPLNIVPRTREQQHSTMQLAHSGLTELPKQVLPPNFYSSILFLNLSENSIQNVSKQFFGCFPSLSTLDLRCNRLSTLHCDVSMLQNLRVLHLGYNALSSLPFSIGGLAKLEILSVPNNRLTSLPSSISALSNTLATLNIAENLIKVVPEELCQLESLSALNIYHNHFVSLPSNFWKLAKLEELTLEWFGYASPPLPTTLKGLEGAKILSLLRNLCKEVWNYKARELSVMAFLQAFSEDDCSALVGRKYVLHMAAGADDLGVLEGVVLYEPDAIDVIDKEGRSALCIALLRGHVEAAKILLARGATVNAGVADNSSLLHLAVNTLNVDLVKTLIGKGTDPNFRDSKGNSPLHNLFLSFSAKPHIRDAIAKLLLSAGADPNLKNRERWCAVHIAVKQDTSDSIETVVKLNRALRAKRMDLFDLNVPGGEERWTPLHVAAFTGCFETVRILLENKANSLSRCADDRVPRHYARTHLSVYKLLYRDELKVTQAVLAGKEGFGHSYNGNRRGLSRDEGLQKAALIPQKYNPTLSLRVRRYTESPSGPGNNASLSTPRTNATVTVPGSKSPPKGRMKSCFTIRKTPRTGEFEQENPYFSRGMNISELQTIVLSNIKRLYERYFALALVATHSGGFEKKMLWILEEAIKRFDKMCGIAYRVDIIRTVATLFPRLEVFHLLLKTYQERGGESSALRYEISSAIQNITAQIAARAKPKVNKLYH